MYFFERFENGKCLYPELPIITTEESEKQFKKRSDGLRVLMINPPIREWSYPNIEPLGQCYIAGSIIIDGHDLDVLDLNCERGKPVKDEVSFMR